MKDKQINKSNLYVKWIPQNNGITQKERLLYKAQKGRI